MGMGYLLRSGQQVYLISYEVFSWQPDGVAVSSVAYRLENGYVESIRIAVDDEILEEAEALELIQEVADMQEISEYFAYPWSAWDGERLAPFTREDLSLLAKRSDELSKGIILAIMVEFYAILCLLATFLMLNNF